MLIDTSFDFRTDASGKDPDKYSPTLRQYHKFLWSKPLPSGRLFDLDASVSGVLRHGEFLLSSDSVIPTFTRWGFAKAHPELYTEEYNNAFMTIAYTIGGMMMVFQGNQIEGKWTINQARGCLRKIADGIRASADCSTITIARPDLPRQRASCLG